MGGCCSRPREEADSAANAPPLAAQNINSYALTTPPALRDPSHPASSSNSVATSNNPHRDVAANQHYNVPLKQHIWTVKPSRRPWTRSKWISKREEFFHTRVTNRPEIWSSLKAVVELLDQHDLETAQGILDASEITLPTGDLADGAYDSFGNLYHLPNYAISAPENMIEEDEKAVHAEAIGASGGAEFESPSRAEAAVISEKGKNVLKPEESITVKARLSDRGGAGQDVMVTIGKGDSTKALIDGVAEKAGVGVEKVKIAYMGRVFKPNKGFVAQGWQTGHVVNALVAP